MFLFERLVGVGIYSLVLIMVYFSLVTKNCNNVKRTLFIYSILLSVLAFFYIPYETADLYRINEYVEAFRKYSFSKLWKKQVLNSEIGLANILYWAIGKTGIPQLLPALISFVCYNCIFYIIVKTAQKNQISGKNVAITLLFYMSTGNYMFVITGIRCMLGVSLLTFCFFRENVEKKFRFFHIPLYLIATLIHSFSAVLIAARFFISIFDKNTTALKKTIYSVLLSGGIIIVFSYFSGFIDEILGKVDSYLSGNIYSYIWEYVISILASIVVICLFFRKTSIIKESNIKLNVWMLYGIALFVISLCFCYEFTIFHRITTYTLPIIAIPLLMTSLQSHDNRYKNAYTRVKTVKGITLNLNSCVTFISVLMLLLACSRGSLSSLKFFVW